MSLLRLTSSVMQSPLWIAQLGTGTKSFTANPVIGSRRLNQWGLHKARLQLAAHVAQQRRGKLASVVDAADQQAFAQNGYVIKENFLPPAAFEQLHHEVYATQWAIREMRQGGTVTRRVPLDLAHLRANHPALAKFIGDAAVRNLIRYVASTGGLPIFWLQTILAGFGHASHDPQSDFHADTFHSNAKAWYFLHDVGPEDGPFAYVPGSHQLTEARLAWEYQQSLTAAQHPVIFHARGSFRAGPDDLRFMGLPDPKRITVKANTLVIADTFGFHARTPSQRPTCRVEIYASLRRNPFRPWNGLDFFSLPYLRDRSGSAHIKALDCFKWAGFQMPWQPRGFQKIDAPPQS